MIAILYYIILYYIILYYIILYYILLYYIKLYYIILFYIKIYYIKPYYIKLYMPMIALLIPSVYPKLQSPGGKEAAAQGATQTEPTEVITLYLADLITLSG